MAGERCRILSRYTEMRKRSACGDEPDSQSRRGVQSEFNLAFWALREGEPSIRVPREDPTVM